MDDYKEKLGLAIDRLENCACALAIPMSNDIHVDALKGSLPEIVKELKEAYVGLTNENPWD